MAKIYFSVNRRTFKAIFMQKTLKMTKNVNFMTSLWRQDNAWQNFQYHFWNLRSICFKIGYEIFFLSDDLQGENLQKKKKVVILPNFTIFPFKKLTREPNFTKFVIWTWSSRVTRSIYDFSVSKYYDYNSERFLKPNRTVFVNSIN